VQVVVTLDGQEDVTWQDWLDMAATCERLGFDGLFRSDHYASVEQHPERDALEAWGTVCALAAVTSRLRLGTLVSPMTLRHPSVLAKLAVTADHVSGGRVEVGLGAGWLEAEHTAFGFHLPPLRERMDAFGEQLEILTRSWADDGPFSFHGEHWRIEGLDARPKPVQARMPLIVGGLARPRSLGFAARWATEYSLVYVRAEEIPGYAERIAAACTAIGRDPATLPLSVVSRFLVGADEADLARRAAALDAWAGTPVDLAELRHRHFAGTPEEVASTLAALREAGVARVYLQFQLHRDHEQLELLAAALAAAGR
jgi:alkanesulfonate monooxygenase SsuD/methylene tetrahydromethanopterin reductase-like flavin-dependent oxidoreductase (luciferase family)